jgi:hypothetical protein
MSNENVYKHMFNGVRFKSDPEVPTDPDFDKLLSLLSSKEWLEAHQEIVKAALESNDFLVLFHTSLSEGLAGKVKFEAYKTSIIIKVCDSKLTILLEESKAGPEDKKQAAALKLIELARSPIFEEVNRRKGLIASQATLRGRDESHHSYNTTDNCDIDHAINPKRFFDTEIDSSEENERPSAKKEISFGGKNPFNSAEKNFPEKANILQSLNEEDERPQLEIDTTQKTLECTKGDFEQQAINKSMSTRGMCITEEHTVTKTTQFSDKNIIHSETNVISNQKFKKTFEDSDISVLTPTPGTPRALKEPEQQQDEDDVFSWTPTASCTVVKLFEDIYIEEFVKREDIEATREFHPYPIQVGVKLRELTSDWHTDRLLAEVTEGLRREGLDLYCSIQNTAFRKKKQDQKNVLFLVKSKEGRLVISDQVTVSSKLAQTTMEKLALYRFLSGYFPLLAAKIAQNTLRKALNRKKKEETLTRFASEPSSVSMADRPQSEHRSFPVIKVQPKNELSFGCSPSTLTFNLSSLRDTYEAQYRSVMVKIYTANKDFERVTSDKLDSYFGFEVVHRPGAVLERCQFKKSYMTYRKRASKELSDPATLQNLIEKVKKVEDVQEAIDLITYELFKELPVALLIKEKNQAAIFMSSKDPTLVVDIRIDSKKTLSPKDYLAFGSMVFLRLAVKELYKPVESIWKEKVFDFAN